MLIKLYFLAGASGVVSIASFPIGKYLLLLPFCAFNVETELPCRLHLVYNWQIRHKKRYPRTEL